MFILKKLICFLNNGETTMHEAKQRRSINQWASVMTRNFVLLQDETHLLMKLIFVRNRGSTSQSKLCFPPITVFTLHLSNAEASLSLSLSLSYLFCSQAHTAPCVKTPI